MASGGMSPNTARKLAALIVAGAEQLEERAQQQGVTAFLGKAVQREKPNERFLQNTLKNLASANRRVDERGMWAAWEAQKQLRGSGSSPLPQHGQSRASQHDYNGRRADTVADSRERGDDGREAYSKGSRKRHRDGSRGRRGPADDSGRYSSKRSRSRSSSRSRSRCLSEGGEDGEVEDRRVQKRYWRGADPNTAADNDAGTRSSKQDSPSTAAAAAAAAAEHGTQISCSSSSLDGDRPDVAEASSDPEAPGDDDQQLVQWLSSSKAVKGRGTIGPSADLPGPYLKPPGGLNPGEAQRLEQGSVKGPARPAWLKKDEEAANRLVPNAGFLRGVMRAQGIVPAEEEVKQGLLFNEGTQCRKSHSSSGSSSSSGSKAERMRRKSSRKSKKHKKKHKHSSKSRKKHKSSRHKA